ncbi:MAG: RsmE family RNA methyltransferase [Fidelibacterota bacterium]
MISSTDFDQLFYDPHAGEKFPKLSLEESWHCIRVLRHRNEDEIFVVDGQGSLYRCIITDPDEKSCGYEVLEISENWNQKNYTIHLAVGLIKDNSRLDWMMEKAVESGVDEITIIKSQFTQKKTLNQNRLVKIAIAAMKQSKQAKLPNINSLINFENFLKNTKPSFEKFIAHENINHLPLIHSVEVGGNSIIVIGPEGGFSEEELRFRI